MRGSEGTDSDRFYNALSLLLGRDEFAALGYFPARFPALHRPPARSRPPTLPLPLRAQRPALGPRWSSVGRSVVAHSLRSPKLGGGTVILV